jgi:hypothetical protein
MLFPIIEDFTCDTNKMTATHKSGAIAHFYDHGQCWSVSRTDDFSGPIELLEEAATIAMRKALERHI